MHYNISEIISLTHFTAKDIFLLEDLGIFPSSACHQNVGRFWIAHEVDEWIEFLDQPGVFGWIGSLLNHND